MHSHSIQTLHIIRYYIYCQVTVTLSRRPWLSKIEYLCQVADVDINSCLAAFIVDEKQPMYYYPQLHMLAILLDNYGDVIVLGDIKNY